LQLWFAVMHLESDGRLRTAPAADLQPSIFP